MFSKEEELDYKELKRKLAVYDEMKRIEMDRIALRDQELDDIKEAEERAYQEAFEEAFKKGQEEVAEEVARNLLKEGYEIEWIAEVTGLSKEQMEKLRETNSGVYRNLCK